MHRTVGCNHRPTNPQHLPNQSSLTRLSTRPGRIPSAQWEGPKQALIQPRALLRQVEG